MFKKVLSLLVSVTMIFVLTSCNKNENKKAKENEKQTETAAEKIVETEEIAEETAEEASEYSEESEAYEETVEVVDVTLIENDDCSIKVTSVVPDYEFGYKLGLSMTNNSGVTLYFTTDKMAIDNLEIAGYFGEKVEPGKTMDGEIVFRKESCAMAENLKYSDILLSLKVYDYDDEKEIYAEDIVHIYPDGEENAKVYKRDYRRNDRVLINSNGLKLTLINFDKDEYYAFANVYLENNSEEEVAFSCKDVSVNGYMISTNFYVTLLPGTSGYAKISWANSALAENNIDRVRNVGITIYARPVSSYDNIVEETFSL